MRAFNEKELKLISRLKERSPQSVLRTQGGCPHHSYCNPLPLFLVYKIDDETFEAQWNEFHEQGPRQVFRFADVA